ncbi:MAG: hypothetical protein GY950_14265, partial [bacterium]|nr:hypothetical protein [bacterium]
LEIDVPPLRQRKDDIKALLLENQKYLRGREPGEGFWEVVLNYNWPGNVRELITVLKRAGIMLESPISGDDLKSIIHQGIYKKSFEEEEVDKTTVIWEEIQSGKSFRDVLWPLFMDREVDRDFVKRVLRKAYMQSSNNFKKMITILNINKDEYQNFMSLMYKYKIDPRD